MDWLLCQFVKEARRRGNEGEKEGKILQSSKSPYLLFTTWVVKIEEETHLSKEKMTARNAEQGKA